MAGSGKARGMQKTVFSIDLSALEENETGVALLRGGRIETLTLHTDSEVVEFARESGASLIGIDAPLTLPAGRKDIDVRDGNHFRECDLKLRELGIRFFPVTIGGMRALTKRGMGLKRKLMEGTVGRAVDSKGRTGGEGGNAQKEDGEGPGKPGLGVVEIFPGASLDMLRLERKNVAKTNGFLSPFGCRAKSVHESDAAIGAYTLLLYLQGEAMELGGEDGRIIIAKK